MTINNSTNSRFFAFPAVNIDGTATGATTLFTSPANFVVTGYSSNLSAATGSTTGITFNIGTNAASYNNIASNEGIPSMNAGEGYSNTFNDTITVAAGGVVRLNVTIADATATVYTVQVSLFGVFI